MFLGTENFINNRFLKLIMRLIPQKSRAYKGKAYYKFLIVIPSKVIKKLGWKGGEELEAETKKNKLIIEKKV